MVGRTERARGDEGVPASEEPGDRENFGDFDAFFEIELGEDRGERFGENGLPASRRTAHQDIVAPGGGDFEGAFGVFLAADVLHIEEKGFFLEERFHIDIRMRSDRTCFAEVSGGVEERRDRNHGDAAYHRCFGGVFLGNIELGKTEALGEEGDREDTANGADFAVQGEFTDEEFVSEIEIELFGCQEKPESHRYVVDRGILGQIGRGEVDGNAAEAVWREKTAIFDGGTDAVAGFLDRGIGEADHSEMVHPCVKGIDFDFDEFALESQRGGRKQFGRHEGSLRMINGKC